MQIEFTDEEIIFIYGTVKNELNAMKSQKNVHFPKSDLKLHEDLLAKFEEAYPSLTHIPI